MEFEHLQNVAENCHSLAHLQDPTLPDKERSRLLQAEWQAITTRVYLVSPMFYFGLGQEVRPWYEGWWLEHIEEQFVIIPQNEVVEDSLVRADWSDENKAAWEKLDSEVCAVYGDRSHGGGGLRNRWEQPQLVRYWCGGLWLSLWHGVCEILHDDYVAHLELMAAASWDELGGVPLLADVYDVANDVDRIDASCRTDDWAPEST